MEKMQYISEKQQHIVNLKNTKQGVDMTGKYYTLRHTTPSMVNLTDKKFGELYVIGYTDKKTWLCLCDCGNIKLINGDSLKLGKTKSCGHATSGFKDLTGMTFGELYVRKYISNLYYEVECSCGKIYNVLGNSLRSGHTKSCGHATTGRKDITGQTFDDICVHRYIGNLMYECECSCGRILNIAGASLRTGVTKSCGHATNAKKDLTGQKINSWFIRSYITDKTVLEEAGFIGTSLNKTYVLAECECGRTQIVDAQSIRLGVSKSCGHCNRTDEQIRMTSSRENFYNTLNLATVRMGHKPYLEDISKLTGLGNAGISYYITLYGAQQYVDYHRTVSQFELQIVEFINSLNINIIQNDRAVLNGRELDIYIPDKQLAIECNGDYWHSNLFKPKNYHQQKTLQCIDKNIHLVHIFEHEWNNKQTQTKLKNLIKQLLDIDQQRLYARNTVVKEITNVESNDFLNKYHLQDAVNANVCLGLFYNNELIELMTFGKPRFNSEYEIELLRLCTKTGYKVIGGASKLFNYYLRKYNPESIVSYCDISKFTGRVYEQLGMKYDNITPISYMYVNATKTNVLSRMQCTKQRLVEQGWGDETQSESEIMSLHGFTKLYTCGNKRYVYWRTEHEKN